jgi:hypothetical protein
MKLNAWFPFKTSARPQFKVKSRVSRRQLCVVFLMALLVSFQIIKVQPSVAADSTCNPPIASEFCQGKYRPYFVVQGGDIIASNGFDSGGNSCSTGYNGTTSSAINSWNTNNSDGNGYYGAASQGATLSDDVAYQVVSGLNSDLPIGSLDYTYPATEGRTPDSFGFANKGVPPYVNESPNYGGNFYTTACMPDYYQDSMAANPSPVDIPADAITSPNTVNLSLLPSGNYKYVQANGDGPLIIDDTVAGNNMAIPNSVKINLTVNGNVYIKNDIKYAPYSSLSEIPQFNLYAYGETNRLVNAPHATTYGNIYLAPAVNELHGFFVAQGNDQVNPRYNFFTDFGGQPEGFTYGLFSTCATISGNTITNTTDYSTCDNQLTIYGSAAANVFWLERSYGGLSSLSPNSPPTLPTLPPGTTNAENAAEVFRYTPELWIPDDNDLDCAASADCTTTTYQAETSLPPVL